MTQRLKNLYVQTIVPKLISTFNYQNTKEGGYQNPPFLFLLIFI